MPASIVKVENLVKRYKEVIALDHFNLDIKEGEVFGLLGPNGSGKTTAINCILSLLTYDKGTIEVFEKPMTPTSYNSKRDIGVILQNVAVFDELTVEENIDYFCSLYIKDRKKCKTYTDEAIKFVDLEKFRKFHPKKLSGGLLRRLNIACGIAHKPKLIFMDEPTVAVDPQSRQKILDGILELNKNGSTIIYTTHYMEEVEQICDRILIMDNGRGIAAGTKNELKSMISTGETVTIDIPHIDEHEIYGIKDLPNVIDATYRNESLTVKCTNGKHNLMSLLEYLNDNEIPFGKVYSELPTLNDVFLEITGKHLMDNAEPEEIAPKKKKHKRI